MANDVREIHVTDHRIVFAVLEKSVMNLVLDTRSFHVVASFGVNISILGDRR